MNVMEGKVKGREVIPLRILFIGRTLVWRVHVRIE